MSAKVRAKVRAIGKMMVIKSLKNLGDVKEQEEHKEEEIIEVTPEKQ